MTDHASWALRLWRSAPGLTLALLASLFLVLFFAIRLGMATLQWSDAERQDMPLAPWMTPRFVVHSWDVPPELVATVLELEQGGSGRRITIEQLAKDRGVPPESLIAALQAAIAAHRGQAQ